MNWLALYFASGESLYAGAVVLLVVAGYATYMKSRWAVRGRNAAVLLGVALMLLASAPLANGFYAILIGAFLFWFVAWNIRGERKPRVRVLSGVLVAAAVAVFVAMELPYRFKTKLAHGTHDHLTVIGDSITAGIDTKHVPWPTDFEMTTRVRVKNLSRPGIGVAEALELSKKITPEDTLVLLEIGGNDLLGDVPTEDFRRDLGKLLEGLDRPGRRIVMFELPLLPHKIGLGRAQRTLTKMHHVTLIPRRCFVDILEGGDATSDGLHLSGSGAARMSELVREIVGKALAPAASGPATRR